MAERLYLYDTTLRDGAQTAGVTFSVADKRRIARDLDELGVDYVEGGWPGANPTDDAFFAEAPPLRRAKFCAFGMTRRSGRSAANDPVLAPLWRSGAQVVTLVGKSSPRHVKGALGVDLDENLRMIADTVAEALRHAEEAILDAEHFFDGFKEDPAYALACLDAALEAGARWVVLCDTNGGALPHEVEAVTGRVAARVAPEKLGIHAHDDTGNAVANSLAAVRAGARQIQGTLNGLGERCGNANLVSLIPTLKLKLGHEIGVDDAAMRRLAHLSRNFDEQLNRTPNRQAAYVGASAFAHKAGLHASAVAKDPGYYEHVDPDLVGNAREVLVSDQAGRANLLQRFAEMGLDVDPDPGQTAELLAALKERESSGYSYDGATASFELLVRRALGGVPSYFALQSFRVMDEHRFNALGRRVVQSEATIKLIVGETVRHQVADGNGPVNALDLALRAALSPSYPSLEGMRLVDYKVRIVSPRAGTAAVTRVVIESEDDRGRLWQTVGVSENIIEASFEALEDSISYKLVLDGVRGPVLA